jgi:CP family cyanate transporter-like MFS transporter
VLLTVPLLLPALHGSWRAALALWALPVAIIALAVQILAPRVKREPALQSKAPLRWLPDWHIGLVWRLGALFCCVNAIYFSANAFIPIYLTSMGRPDLISHALLALNVGQLPASFLLLAVAGRLERRAWPFIAAGLGSLVALAGLVLTVGPVTIAWAALLGFSDAAALILGLTLPPLLCRPEDVARTSAGMFTLSYGGAVAITVASGVAWDLSGVPASAFAPLAVCAAGLMLLPVALLLKKELR